MWLTMLMDSEHSAADEFCLDLSTASAFAAQHSERRLWGRLADLNNLFPAADSAEVLRFDRRYDGLHEHHPLCNIVGTL